jgi:hypothetical protein
VKPPLGHKSGGQYGTKFRIQCTNGDAPFRVEVTAAQDGNDVSCFPNDSMRVSRRAIKLTDLYSGGLQKRFPREGGVCRIHSHLISPVPCHGRGVWQGWGLSARASGEDCFLPRDREFEEVLAIVLLRSDGVALVAWSAFVRFASDLPSPVEKAGRFSAHSPRSPKVLDPLLQVNLVH